MTARSARTSRQRKREQPQPLTGRRRPVCVQCLDQPPLPRSTRCLDCLISSAQPQTNNPAVDQQRNHERKEHE